MNLNPEKQEIMETAAPAEFAPQENSAPAAAGAAEKIFAERAAMLAAVERYIPVRLREKLRQKIAAERERFARLVAAAPALRRRAPAAAPVLNPDFFELRPLEINLFE